MDSDSESQDSDDGRRFRFEATRKDDGAQRRKHQESSLRNQSRHKSRHLSSSDKSKREESYRESKYKHDNSKNIVLNSREDKDSKYMARRSKDTHTSRGHRERSRDSKHYRDRDRVYKERSRDGKKSPINKHRHESHERHRHSNNKSRDRSHRADKIKLEENDKFRDELNKHDSLKKDCDKQNKTQLKNHVHDESVQMNTSNCSMDNQSCKEIDLSDYDVLSETDETFSDASDIINEKSLSTLEKSKIVSGTSNEICLQKQELENRHKVNATNNDQLSGSSNNDSSTISDSALSIIAKNKEYQNVEDRADDTCKYFNETDFQVCTKNSSDVDTITPAIKTRPNIYGPSLPPNLLSDTNCTEKKNHETDMNNSNVNIGNENGQLESRTNENSEQSMETTEDLAFGPVLPPHLKQKEMDQPTPGRFVGPLPQNLVKSNSEDESLQADSKCDDDNEGIGPLPPNHPSLKNNYVHQQLELRAMNFHNELAEKVDNYSNKREEWMVELPPAQAVDLGLGPRKFRVKAGPDMSDRSCWTDTPSMKTKKKKEAAEKMISTKEPKNTTMIEPSDKSTKNRKRERSLVEIHQENLAKKQKKKDSKTIEKSTRRPFNRDVDLQANRFDQAQKKAILKKAQMLDDRFARGKI